MANESIKLNLIPAGDMPVFHCSQFDNGRLIIIELYNGEDAYELPEGYTAELHCRKVDNNIVTLASTLVNTNVVTFTSTTQLCACNGKNLCEVAIKDASDFLIGTLNFWLEVELDPLKGGINSTSEIHDLYDQIEVITTEVIGDDYYNKTEVDNLLDDKADKSTTYTKTQVDTALSAKANSDDVYAKTDTYSKAEIDTNIYTKNETYNKTEVDGIINNLPAPMIFKGTLGVNGTITTLPTASTDNEGFTYKVITDGTYASQTAKVGDMFTSNGSAWVLIPSGDETFTDTWRSIKVNGSEKLTSSIISGAVDFKNGTNSTVAFNTSDNSIKINVDGYTKSQIDTKLAAKANSSDVYTKSEVDGLVELVSDISGNICSFDTDLAVNLVDVKTTLAPSLTGYTEVNLTANGDTTTIALGDTYYGGTLDVTTGVLTVTYGNVDLGSLNWSAAVDGRIVCKYDSVKLVTSSATKGNILSLYYITDTQNNVWNRTNNKTIAITNNPNSTLIIYDVDLENKTANEVKTALSGKYAVFELATPIVVTGLTPVQIAAIVGQNNVFSDTGDTTVKYKEGIQHYIDKKVST